MDKSGSGLTYAVKTGGLWQVDEYAKEKMWAEIHPNETYQYSKETDSSSPVRWNGGSVSEVEVWRSSGDGRIATHEEGKDQMIVRLR
jgi:hypothetical protein